MPEQPVSYRFGEFRVDVGAARLLKSEVEVDLPPRAFQVLAYLLEHRHRVISKQELVEAVWKDTFVTDDALVQAVSTIRQALSDHSENPRYIRTRPRVGYQFISPVTTETGAEQTSREKVSLYEVPVQRSTARLLMLLTQVGYLALYCFTLFNLEIASRALGRSLLERLALGGLALPLLLLLTLVGLAVRLYLLTTVGLDHPATGRQFFRLAPVVFTLDLLWAFCPLLLAEETGLPIALALIPILVYSPFSQAALVRSAYPSGVV